MHCCTWADQYPLHLVSCNTVSIGSSKTRWFWVSKTVERYCLSRICFLTWCAGQITKTQFNVVDERHNSGHAADLGIPALYNIIADVAFLLRLLLRYVVVRTRPAAAAGGAGGGDDSFGSESPASPTSTATVAPSPPPQPRSRTRTRSLDSGLASANVFGSKVLCCSDCQSV